MKRITINFVYLFCGSFDAGEEKVLFIIVRVLADNIINPNRSWGYRNNPKQTSNPCKYSMDEL